MDTRSLNLTPRSDIRSLRKAAKICRVKVPQIDEFLGSTICKALAQGKDSPESFGRFFSSQAKAWRMSNGDRRRRKGSFCSLDKVGDPGVFVNPETILAAREALAMLDRLSDIDRDTLLAEANGEIPDGVSPQAFRKRLSRARAAFRKLCKK